MTKQPVYNLLSNEIKNLDKDSKLILEDLKLSVLKLKDIVSKKKEYYNSWQYQIDLCKEVINDFKKNPLFKEGFFLSNFSVLLLANKIKLNNEIRFYRNRKNYIFCN